VGDNDCDDEDIDADFDDGWYLKFHKRHVGTVGGTYATVADMRCEGVPSRYPDDVVLDKLKQASQYINLATKQWFESRAMEIIMDGNDSRTLFLPVPIISVHHLYMNGDFRNHVPQNIYVVYNGNNATRDDRRNPMIKINGAGLGVYDFPDFRRGSIFVQAEMNQKIVGQFGFVEPDGSTPLLIKRATMKLAIRQLQQSPTGKMWPEVENGPPAMGNRTAETTDGHTITYNAFGYMPVHRGNLDITNDPEVDSIINLYRAPIKIASTSSRGGPDRRW
jgi:hypothetical protein